METPATRLTGRMDMPSTSMCMLRIWTRLSVGSLFILLI
jgi:hypothetical protein